MVHTNDILQLSRQIAERYSPDRIILFGSYAYGSPTDDSDVDLLVILPHQGKPSRIAARILTELRPSFPVDILVRSEEQIQNRVAQNDFFMKEITSKGKTLFANSDSRMG